MATKRAPAKEAARAADDVVRPTVQQLDDALRAFVETRDAVNAANAANQVAREALVRVLNAYGLSGFVP